jgi:hypothetical protein
MDLDLQVSLSKLFAAGIKEEQINGLDVIILPENFNGDQDVFDGQDAITLSKLLKQQNIKCANSFDLNLDAPTKERRGNDIWLGQLYILNDFVLPIVTGVIGSLLATAIADRKKRKDLRAPASNVHAEISINKRDGITNIQYSGDPEALVKILKVLECDENEE